MKIVLLKKFDWFPKFFYGNYGNQLNFINMIVNNKPLFKKLPSLKDLLNYAEKNFNSIEGEELKEFFKEYSWNCPLAFNELKKLLLLFKTPAPKSLLHSQMELFVSKVTECGFEKTDIGTIKQFIYKNTPGLEKAIREGKKEKVLQES